MKYTKDFEKYWSRIEKRIWLSLHLGQLAKTKRIAFLAYKAGIEKTKRDYCLVKHISREEGDL